MSIIDKLASSLGRKDEVPNQELAKLLADQDDKAGIKELVALLSNKSKDIQSDAIKCLYEVAGLKPQLVSAYINELITLLDHKNNRLQWGAMTAIHAVTQENPAAIFDNLAKIIAVADKGSVITNDHCVGILIKLCGIPKYAKDSFSLLNERLLICPTNQLPMYAENALPIIQPEFKETFIQTLTKRLREIDKDSKRIRVEKVIKKLNK